MIQIKLILFFCAFVLVRASPACPKLRPEEKSIKACVVINTWMDFVSVVSKSTSHRIVFCPFSVQKYNSKPLVIKKDISIFCQVIGRCKIESAFAMGNVGRFIQIKGPNAKVSFVGFSFVGGGDHQEQGLLYSTIKISYNAGGGSEQMFCNCTFSENEGEMLGVALRAEAGTAVILRGCDFNKNVAKRHGTIFNRGTMTVEECNFSLNRGKGNAISSSRKSSTSIIRSTFNSNKEGAPLFFYDENNVNLLDNVAQWNECNGVFFDQGKRCVVFEEDTVLEAKQTNLSTSDESTCERRIEGPCINISSFDSLVEIVKEEVGTVVICPFDLEKEEEQFILVTTELELFCSIAGECKIKGDGSHLVVKGSSAKLYLQGFVFQESTVNAIRIQSGAHVNVLCRCSFLRNSCVSRGAGILTERNTFTEISHCKFDQCKTSDIGGAIFNRGQMLIQSSFFHDNIGRGGSIAVAPKANVRLKDNQIIRNSKGEPIFLHENDIVDLGGNHMESNLDCNCCNGLFIQRENKRCISVKTSNNKDESPTTNSTVTTISASLAQSTILRADRGGVGYFNYDNDDLEFGPKNWSKVRNNPEYLRHQLLSETLRRSLENKCGRENQQSPIDLCEDLVNNECHEHHQTRTRSGWIKLEDNEVTAEILPSKLRLKYYDDRIPQDGKKPPTADYAHHWNGYIEVNHVDVKIPSEHTVCGKRFPAEISIWSLHPGRRQFIVTGILIDFHETDESNSHLQRAIDEWQRVYDDNRGRCQLMETSRKFYDASSVVGDIPLSEREDKNRLLLNNTAEDVRMPNNRSLNNNRRVRKIWDPFHPSIMTSIYHWGYWGSFTEPPCSPYVHWRVLSEAAYISRTQWDQMRKILFTNVDENCKYTSTADTIGAARPTQPFRNRDLHKCRSSDYVSDTEKQRMREETGNPYWCC